MISEQQLAKALLKLGLRPGLPLMLHVSMRKLGPVEGRAAGLISAVTQALGPDGTLLMVLDADPDEPFDALTTPGDVEDMGIVAEVFRTTDSVQVNDHVAARFAARGPHAQTLLEPIPLHDYFGPGSIFERFVALDGQVLRLGPNIDTVTLTHYAEYLADVPNKRRVRRHLLRADIGHQWVESLDDSDGIVDWPHGDYFSQILIDFIAAGMAKQGPVGQCTAELLNARTFVPFATQWMETHLR